MKPPYWDDASRTLAARDGVLAGLVQAHPGIHLTRRGDPFTTLARAIVGQQISVKAAQSIWDRFVAATGPAAASRSRSTRHACGRTRMPTLRRAGLSERKALYLRDLARHFVSGGSIRANGPRSRTSR